MASIGVELYPDALVLTEGRDFKWTFENVDSVGSPVDYPAGDLFFELDTGGQHNAVQRIGVLHANQGTYRLGFDGNYPALPDIDYSDISVNPQGQPGDITDYIERIQTVSIPYFPRNDVVGAGNVKVSDVELYPEWRFDVQLTGSPQNEIQAINITNEITEIATFLGIPIGNTIGEGTFKLRNNHHVTDALSFDATAAEVEAALELLPSIGPGNVVVTKPADYSWRIEYVNNLANRNIDQIRVDIFKKDKSGPFDVFKDVWTTIKATTVQQGQKSAFDEELVNLVNKTVNDFFNLFDTALGVNIEFTVDNPTVLNPTMTPSMSLVVTGLKPWTANTIPMFLLNNVIDSLQGYMNGILDWAHVWSVVSVNFAWNTYFNVEFVGELAEWEVPKLTADASGLTEDSNEVQPEVTVEVIHPGKNRYDRWHFNIAGSIASLKVESEAVNKINNRTNWQLVFLADGEPAGGDAIARGTVVTQK
jgi:hypothetical protein